MSRLIIQGARPLKGRVRVSGAKNSVLPIIAASLLADGRSVIEEVPYLNDVKIMCELVNSLGASTEFPDDRTRLEISNSSMLNTTAPYELVNRMRASFLVAGPLLARCGHVKISLPGGCAIGSRPVDLHLKGFAALGGSITQGHGYIEIRSGGRLKGDKVYLDFPSVGATENIMMAAALAEGHTVIENAATEPEITDLATYLTSMGADIKGAGTDTIKINGVRELYPANHTVIPDRIEAGTYMVAAAITRGDIIIENIVPDHLKPVTAKLRESGAEISEELTSVRVKGNRIDPVDIKTHPYPGFPTDMQSQITSLLSVACGTSMVVETIFENRFMHVCELKRMGANIKVEGRSAIIEGCSRLSGTKVKATDLRAGAALILAGLCAEGTTEILDIEHVDRGYLRIDEKLKRLGAVISRSDDE
ncbi:MAG: UDP-N-acetylglucosamine 1-carboxyvinyltransferase [Acetivibrionales bacterium]|nr:UDP-N-acetylglucosamine 1-carboxyvinyltransferase [Bacillota bacterium]NLP08356.1 UDP-N-acetylglucosamine 1-carboxyvinyltransferase [Clostridiaceae bacterium]HOA54670.1 UDP-N-acetylglucosamine 1-carboxyvinyltransferase [Clostridiales bacterium]HQD30026.1 UDP-N-acetylglucosamine 1-carboxyvinyltransferase [Clostridiales bacterium]